MKYQYKCPKCGDTVTLMVLATDIWHSCPRNNNRHVHYKPKEK